MPTRVIKTSVALNANLVKQVKKWQEVEHRNFSNFTEHALWLRVQELEREAKEGRKTVK